MAKSNKQPQGVLKAALEYGVYVPLGATELLIDKARELTGSSWQVWQTRGSDLARAYRGLAQRGEKLAKSVRTSAYTRRAVDQTKVARAQVRSATTSVRKAVSSSATATKAAAKKVS